MCAHVSAKHAVNIHLSSVFFCVFGSLSQVSYEDVKVVRLQVEPQIPN